MLFRSVVSAEFEVVADDAQKVVNTVKSEMSRITAWADANGAIIGHLKGFVQPYDGAYMLSTTGGEVNISGELTLEVGVTGIMFGAELDAVQAQLIELSQNTLNAFGITEIDIEVCDEEHEHNHAHDSHSHSHHDHGSHDHDQH